MVLHACKHHYLYLISHKAAKMIIPIDCFVQADILRPINAGYFTQALITFCSKAVIQTNESINCACFWCNHCNLKKASVIPQSKGLCSSTALNRYSSPTQNKTVEGPFTLSDCERKLFFDVYLIVSDQ